MARILISSLGTGQKKEGNYSKAKYEIKNKAFETSFIADALNKHFKFDKIFLIGTKKSIWDEAYTAFGGIDDKYTLSLYEKKEDEGVDEDFLKIFKDTTSQKIEPIIVKYGLYDNELWDNFTEFLKIAENIKDEDELYLDITHSFRSLALMSFVMTQFAHTISDKKFKIKGVYYGMFEYQSENNGVTPIIDIKILLEIQEWIKAIDAIKKYSDFDPLVILLKNDQNIEKSVNNTFINLNNTINIANMTAMKQFISTAHTKILSIKKTSNPVVKLLAPEVLNIVNNLNHEKMSNFQFALAKWFKKNKNYALSYMVLAEAIVTKTCEYKGYDSNVEAERNESKKHIDSPWDKLFSTTKMEKGEIVRNEGSISDIRNNIVHQLNLNSNIQNDITKLSYFLEKFEDYFKL